MNNQTIKICILGGGFGGLYTALYLSNSDRVKSGQWEINLIEPKDNFLFTPLLYELLTEELQPWEIAPSYQKLLIGTKINFYQDQANKIDLKNRQVYLQQGQLLNYDYLVLSIGRKNKLLDLPGLNTHTLTFRSLADAQRLKEKLRILEASGRKKIRIAVIGAGANGIELACKISDRLLGKAQVLLIDRGKEILKNFSSGIKKAALKSIKNKQIQLYLETNVQQIDAEQITLIKDEQLNTFPVDLVLWTAGTETIQLINELGCQQNSFGQLLTRPTLQLIDYPEVFALGDVADIRNSKTRSVPITAQAAYQQASHAAKNLQAAIQGKQLKRFYYLHLGDMLTLGKGVAVISSFGINLSGSLAGQLRRLIYIQRLPTLRHRWQVFKNLLLSQKRSFSKQDRPSETKI
ncbi:MAG: NAD(P)/FAD-dependent oxidoreductase [Stanieria sp.]